MCRRRLWIRSVPVSYPRGILDVKSEGGCQSRQLACFTQTFQELQFITGAEATDFTYLRPATPPCPFTPPIRTKVAGRVIFIKTTATITNLRYPSWCRAWSSPGSRLSIFHAREARRGVVTAKGQFVFPLSLHHRRHYLGSIRKSS